MRSRILRLDPIESPGPDSPQGMAMMLTEEAAGSAVDVRSYSAVPPGSEQPGGLPGVYRARRQSNCGTHSGPLCIELVMSHVGYCQLCEKLVWLL